ncbi:MAG: hypothetical protein WAU53_20620 [Rhodoplanes sp.]
MADDKHRPDTGPPGEIPREEQAGPEQPTDSTAELGAGASADVATGDATAQAAPDSEAGAPAQSANGGDDAEKDAAAPSAENAPEQEPPASRESQEVQAAPVRRRTPWGALFLSGLIGGAVVAAAAAYGWLVYTADEGSIMNVLWARLGAVELAVQDLNSRGPQPTAAPSGGDELAARIAKLEAAVAAMSKSGPQSSEAQLGPTDSALGERLTGLEAVVKSLAEVVARLDRRADETTAAIKAMQADAESGVAPGKQPSDTTVEKAEFEALAQRVTALQQSAASLQQSVEHTAASLQQTASRGAVAAAADRAVRLAVVASGLRSAVQRGAPFERELNAAKALMPDPKALAPLEPFAASGVPTAQALGREFAAIAPKLAQTAKSSGGGDYFARLLSHAERLVHIRPVNEAAGTDTAAIVARAEAKAKRADIPGALAELGKLPEPVRAPAAAWIKKAEGRQAAIAAAQNIENAALAALANP